MSDNDTTPAETPEPAAAPAPAGQPPVEQPPVGQPAAGPWAPPVEQPAPDATAGSPTDIWAAPAVPTGPRRDRATVLRLFAAAAVLVVTATATAVAVTLPDRTDVPGLATPNDGRYSFPQLALPPLPTDGKAPLDAKGRHQADLRGLLLPAPKEALPQPSAAASSAPASASASATASASAGASAAPSPAASLPPVVGRWVPCDSDGVLGRNAAEVNSRLTENACRAVAAQGWTAKDGTRTEIRLIRLGSQAEAADLYRLLSGMSGTKNIESSRMDVNANYPMSGGTVLGRESDAKAASGAATGRIAYLQSGDVVGVLELTNAKGVPSQAFRQVIALQSSLLA